MARIVRELDQADGDETAAARGSALARLFDTLVARQPGSIGSLVARPLPEGWSFTRAPRRRT
jgi:tRNA(Ile)-lysidine synthase